MITCKSIRAWDANFFAAFVDFKNRIYKENFDVIVETLEDLELFFGVNSTFAKGKIWQACLLADDSGRTVGRYLWTHTPNIGKVFLGYFEVLRETDCLEEMRACLEKDFASLAEKSNSSLQVQGPIQASIFNSYRFRDPTPNSRFLGEDLSQDFYSELWKSWGFQVLESWHSFNYSTEKGLSFYESHRLKLDDNWKDQNIQIRTLGEKHWTTDVESIHRITCDAYGFFDSPHFIDLEIFQKMSLKMKPLLNKDFIRILSVDGEDVAFTMALLDVQPLLRQFNQDRNAGGFRKWFAKLSLAYRFKFHKHPLMLLYTAKTKSCRLKWVLALLGGETVDAVRKYQPTSIMTAFTSELTAANSSRPQDVDIYSTHRLYFKNYAKD